MNRNAAMQGLRAFRTDRRGVIAVEFALIIPVFLLMTYGFMELGRALFIQNSLGHAVYEAQRYAIVHGASSSAPADETAIQTVILEKAGMLDGNRLTINVTFTPDNKPGSVVNIEAIYAFEYMTGLVPLRAFDMTSTSAATIAN